MERRRPAPERSGRASPQTSDLLLERPVTYHLTKVASWKASDLKESINVNLPHDIQGAHTTT